MRQIIEIAALLYLAAGSVYDIKKRVIPAWFLAAGTAGALAYAMVLEREGWYLWMAGGAAGLVFVAAGRLTEESIGYGDGWMIGNLGIFCGIWKLSCLLFLAFTGAAVTAGIGMLWKKWPKEKRIPLFPFLLAGYAGGMGIW